MPLVLGPVVLHSVRFLMWGKSTLLTSLDDCCWWKSYGPYQNLFNYLIVPGRQFIAFLLLIMSRVPLMTNFSCKRKVVFFIDNPFAIQEDTGIRANVKRSQFWHQIQKEMCTGPSRLVLFFTAPQLTCMVKSFLSPSWWLGGGWFKQVFVQRLKLGVLLVSFLNSKWRAALRIRHHQNVLLKNITLYWVKSSGDEPSAQ
jgi:hypothetical protein